MPNTKEKLLELSRQLRYCAVDGDCINCERWEFDCGSRKCLDDLLLKAAELLESVANGVTVQQWISVKDRLPEADAGKVLCITQAGHYKILQWIETFDCWSDPFGIDFTNFRNGYIAHWMPLPQPPKGE